MMNDIKQTQKAGDGSNQFQAGTIIINNGIDEKRAREICSEMFEVARRDLTAEAYEVASNRVLEFENDLIPKMQKIDGALESFADPAFQIVITNAHKTAACTDQPADYALLSELLIHRVQCKGNRVTTTGIGRAVEIVDKISDEALLALTITFAIMEYGPDDGSILQGLDTLDKFFSKLYYAELPEGREWLEHLDILDCVRTLPFANKKFEDILIKKLDGYCVVGIKRDSENHENAEKILGTLGKHILIPNELDEDYLRIAINSKASIETFTIDGTIDGNPNQPIKCELTNSQRQAIHQVFELYEKDTLTLDRMKKSFIDELKKRPYLSLVMNWWNQIPRDFYTTTVGNVLAHANAKRCYNTLADLG